ncbi:MAG: hypothetical protein QOH84_5240 [Kribbellaceae bacterium]|jgi:hypothetical protein|nr:hypothetical protein [Kribbellaceae bacterium]
MAEDRGEVLRALRGSASLPAFIDRLVQNGLTGTLTRQRLSDIEQGKKPLTPELSEAIVQALIRSGLAPEAVEPLRMERSPLIEPLPASTAVSRHRQWSRMVARVPESRWWDRPLTVMSKLLPASAVSTYRELFDRYGSDSERVVATIRERLELGRTGGPFHPLDGDAAGIGRAASPLRVRAGITELFLVKIQLHNTGSVPWRNRLLFRLGTPVTASLPLTPAILPVPDTDPGGSCEFIVPGRSQWFANLAVVSYVMVFPDLSSCLPGRLPLWVDTRTDEFDSTFDLPPGFPVSGAAD